MSFLLDKLFSSVAWGHFMVDILNGQRAVLLTFLSVPLGLTNAALGAVSTFYVIAGALTQPIFGFLADRFGPRWVAAGGVLWMGLFFSLGLITPGLAALFFLMIASIGSAAFHPAGTMQATLRGRTFFSGRETTTAAYFFFFGQAGAFFGPMLGGPVLDRYGTVGLIGLTMFSLPVSVNLEHQLRYAVKQPPIIRSAESGGKFHLGSPANTVLLGVFFLVAFFQAWAQQNMVTFIPKYLSDLGMSPSTYGIAAAFFMGGTAIGNAIGGNLADKFGKRRIMFLSLFLAAIPLLVVSAIGWSPWLFVLLPLAGALTGAPHSIIVVVAQRWIRIGMALASGVILGFLFTSGAIGTLISGYLADILGFPMVFRLTALLALLAAFLTLLLNKFTE
ncbi:MAG: major facilitator transporter [Chloroflexi bacterium]|nr:major facilitator transporter [Chloroflexota bacterium]